MITRPQKRQFCCQYKCRGRPSPKIGSTHTKWFAKTWLSFLWVPRTQGAEFLFPSPPFTCTSPEYWRSDAVIYIPKVEHVLRDIHSNHEVRKNVPTELNYHKFHYDEWNNHTKGSSNSQWTMTVTGWLVFEPIWFVTWHSYRPPSWPVIFVHVRIDELLVVALTAVLSGSMRDVPSIRCHLNVMGLVTSSFTVHVSVTCRPAATATAGGLTVTPVGGTVMDTVKWLR